MMAWVVTTFTFAPRPPMSDLVGKFYPLSLAGEDAVLARANHQGAVQPTPLFARL